MLAIKLDKPAKIDLQKLPTDSTGGMTKEEGEGRFAALAEELSELQELLYAAGQNGLLVVLQGRDTAGKDGTLEAVAGAMNPVGVRVASFKVPTVEEQAHDFLWRVHRETPGRGQVVFFNRSHYEDVLVTRVHDLVPKHVWESRFERINQFEALLRDAGVVVLKFYLHISRDEQERRLLAREKDPRKAWKLNAGDWEERAYWDAYTTAYEDALGRCSTPEAPWYVIPADHKWYRNVAIGEAISETLKPYSKSWKAHLEEIGKDAMAGLKKMRESQEKVPVKKG